MANMAREAGFKRGETIATGTISHALLKGEKRALTSLPRTVLLGMVSGAALLYGAVGLAGMLLGVGRPLARRLDAASGYLTHRGRRGRDRVRSAAVNFSCLRGTRDTLMELLGYYNYSVLAAVLTTRIYAVIVRNNFIKKWRGLSIFQSAVFLMYSAMDRV